MLVVFLIAATVCTSGVSRQQKRIDEEGRKCLEEALFFAAIHCYVIESRYPPSIEYLEENYGIQINRNKYAVFYSSFASNLIPDITVVLLNKGG